MYRSRTIIAITFLLLISACGKNDLGPAEVSDNYIQEVEQWKQERVESLKAPTGWLRLSGLYWLDEGENSFGSDEDRDIQFPENSIPEYAGSLNYRDGRVIINAADEVRITHSGEAVSEMLLYEGQIQESPRVQHANLEWFVIKRGDLVGVRLFNKENPQADQFSGVESYPIDPDWNRRARFIPRAKGAMMSIVNVLGQEMDVSSPGILEFNVDGQRYTLDTIEDGESMFIIIGDQTNETDTYQGGRYIYVDYPEDGSEYTQIDFNKIYNPPCAFTVYSTCQLPPPQNQLDLAITAGEKRALNWNGR